MSTTKDWTFDIGFRDDHIIVEPYASSMPSRHVVGLSRSQLLELRRAITRALREYPAPPEVEK